MFFFSTGWMDESIFKTWVQECYVKRPGGFFATSKSLLVLDSMRAHITEGSKDAVKQKNSVMAVIPGGTTKYLQPLDISVNRPFKVAIREEWEKWMGEGEKSFTKTGRMRKATFAQVSEWVLTAWKKVKITTIVNGFVKAGLIESPLQSLRRDDPSATSDPSTSSDESTSTAADRELDAAILQLFESDTEASDFSGFHTSDLEN